MLIGLAGYARAGKDTVGAILRTDFGYKTKAFADPMRAAALAIDPIIDHHGYRYREIVDQLGYDEAKKQPEVRRFLQRLGTEMGRDLFGQNFWVDLTFKDYSATGDLVITDVRYPNEWAAIERRGGVIVRITRPGCGPANDHISEHALDGHLAPWTLSNDGDLAELTAKVRAAPWNG